MNKAHFIKYMEHPETLSGDSVAELSQLVHDFPFCQSARILLSMNLFKEKNIRYETELKMSAIFAGDRYMLRKHIDRLNITNQKIVLPDEYVAAPKRPPDPVQEASTVKEESVKLKHKLDRRKGKEAPINAEDKIARLRRIVEERIKEIEAEAKGEVKKEEKDANGKTKQQLIDEFILKEPGIGRAGKEFFDPIVAAKESVVDQENIVSETLAQIYIDQQHFEKAIHVYEKLSLKFPEKSTYFAGLIEKTKKELKT